MEFRHLFDQSPLFSHFSMKDIAALTASAREVPYAAGESIELKNSRCAYIITSGYFRSKSPMQREESVLFGPGSFLGTLPFADDAPRGTVSAVVASKVLTIEIEELYRILIGSFKTARGYLRMLGRSSVGMNATALEMNGCRTRVTSVIGGKGAGKTIASLALASALSKKGDTILLDMSTAGRSLHDYLQLKLAPPLSQKKAGSMSDSFLRERIQNVRTGFDVMNISCGSNVKIDPGIISPVIFYLSRHYAYIVIDCGTDDSAMKNELLACSDFVAVMPKNRKNECELRDYCARSLSEGQELIIGANRYLRSERKKKSDLVLENIDIETDAIVSIDAASAGYIRAVEQISGKKKIFMLPSGGYPSLHYTGLFPRLVETEGAVVAARSYALILFSFYASMSAGEAAGEVYSFFKNDRIRILHSPVFPKDYLFGNTPVLRALSAIPQDARAEDCRCKVIAHVGEASGSDRFVSAGYLRQLAASAFCDQPFFEPVKTSIGMLNPPFSDSGLSRLVCHCAEQIIECGIRSKGYALPDSVPPLMRGSLIRRMKEQSAACEKWISDKNIFIDADNKKYTLKKSAFESADKWDEALKIHGMA